MKIFNQLEHTHMPYIIDDNTLLFCQAPIKDRYVEEDGRSLPQPSHKNTPYRAYDIFTSDMDGNNKVKIDTGLGEKVCICTPTAFTVGGETKITFAGSLVSTGSLRSYHFEKIGPSLLEMPAKSIRTRNKWGLKIHSPSESVRYIFTPFCNVPDPYFFAQDKEYGTETKYRLNCSNIRRLVPVANNDKVVIILSINDGILISSLVNLETLLVRDIKVNGMNVYKCSILGDTIVHTVRGTGSRYSRQLHKDSYELVPSAIKVWVDK